MVHRMLERPKEVLMNETGVHLTLMAGTSVMVIQSYWSFWPISDCWVGSVWGALHPTAVWGTYIGYAILSEDELTAKPVSISHVEASVIPFAALTAWRALKSTARITQGQRVLVVSGEGAVGFATIQLAVATEYHVSTICGSESIDWAMSAGAEQAVGYTTQVIARMFYKVLDLLICWPRGLFCVGGMPFM